MSTIEHRRSGGLRMLDTLLVAAGVVCGILVVVWLVHALFFVFKVVIFVVVVAILVRLVHLLTRGRR
jgi:Flp pilus assembly protein TadB